MDIVRQIFAPFFAFIFAVIVLVALIVFGTPVQRNVAILAALLGCISQFAGQDERPVGRWMNIGGAYAGFLLIGIAVIIGAV